MKEKAEGSLQSQRTKAADNVPYKFLARLDNRMPCVTGSCGFS